MPARAEGNPERPKPRMATPPKAERSPELTEREKAIEVIRKLQAGFRKTPPQNK